MSAKPINVNKKSEIRALWPIVHQSVCVLPIIQYQCKKTMKIKNKVGKVN